MRSGLCFWNLSEILVPLVFKLLPGEEVAISDASLKEEGRTVPSNPDFLINFPHGPLELALLVVWEVVMHQPHEDVADGGKLPLELLAVELEGVVHYVTVVESGHNKGGSSLLDLDADLLVELCGGVFHQTIKNNDIYPGQS